MKKILFTITCLVLVCMNVNAQFGDLIKKANEVMSGQSSLGTETSSALKEALNLGVNTAVQELSVENGYLESPYKILIPKDAQQVIDRVKLVPGFKDVERDLISKMNQAAEIAAKKATPFFLKVIKDMTIQDASQILMGDNNAATSYLEQSTRTNLYATFMPVIRESLDEVNARTYWTSVVSAYNKIPFVKKLNPELDDHVNSKALDGLFALIQTKEAGIRGDQNQRTTALLRKVFAKQD